MKNLIFRKLQMKNLKSVKKSLAGLQKVVSQPIKMLIKLFTSPTIMLFVPYYPHFAYFPSSIIPFFLLPLTSRNFPYLHYILLLSTLLLHVHYPSNNSPILTSPTSPTFPYSPSTSFSILLLFPPQLAPPQLPLLLLPLLRLLSFL